MQSAGDRGWGTDRRVRAIGLAGLLSVLALLLSLPVAATTQEEGTLQSEGDPEVALSFLQPTMYLHGVDAIEQDWRSWETWNHAHRTKDQGAASLDEQNLLTAGDPNYGGGRREFLFAARVAVQTEVIVDPGVPIHGTIRLDHICNQQCDRSMTVVLVHNNRDISREPMSGPTDEANDIYEFNLSHTLKLLEAGDMLEVEVSFTKPSSFQEGYNLHLGTGNAELTFPLQEPRAPLVPGLTFEDGAPYESPYQRHGAGFGGQEAYSTGWLGIILMTVLALVLGVGGLTAAVMFAPPMSFVFRELPILIMVGTMIASVAGIPAWHGPIDIATAQDTKQADIYSVEELAMSPELPGTYLGLNANETFTLWVEYDQLHRRTVGGTTVYGLDFNEYASALDDPEPTAWWAKQLLQYHFSLLAIDVSSGSGVAISVPLVTDAATSEVVPIWAASQTEERQFVDLGSDLGSRWLVPEIDSHDRRIITTYGHAAGYQWMPMMIGWPVALLIGGLGAWLWFRGVARGGGGEWGTATYDRDAFYSRR